MSLKECFEKGLLKKITVDKGRIEGSLDIAKHFIGRAQGNLEKEFFDVAFLMAYISMFHIARALLFKWGYKERSHYCLIAMLLNKFRKKENIFQYLKTLDSYRMTRHAVQYLGALSSQVDAEEAINDAKGFLKTAKEYLNEEYGKRR